MEVYDDHELVQLLHRQDDTIKCLRKRVRELETLETEHQHINGELTQDLLTEEHRHQSLFKDYDNLKKGYDELHDLWLECEGRVDDREVEILNLEGKIICLEALLKLYL